MDIDEITGTVIGAAMRIHTALGPGLLESVYERILARDLRRRGLVVDRQQSIDFHFDGMLFEDAFRPDLIIEGAVIVEVKSVESIAPVHARQLLTTFASSTAASASSSTSTSPTSRPASAASSTRSAAPPGT